jgi:hypothetical protein
LDGATLMPGTRRVPLHRQTARPQITLRAIELFTQMERARRARKRAVGCTITRHGYCTGDCRACCAWDDAHAELCTELRLPPWRWPCIGYNPYPPNSPEARAWRPGGHQRELEEALNEARQSIKQKASSDVSAAADSPV